MKTSIFMAARLFCGLTLFFITSQPSMAYDSDTHYAFTYYLARATGYTPLQSLRIASADYGVDLDPVTEPHSDLEADRFKWTDPRYQTIRVLFHAMWNQKKYEDCLWRLGTHTPADKKQFAAAKNELYDRKRDFEANCYKLGNIGPYLHFLQDFYAHAGFGSILGHGDYTQFLPQPNPNPSIVPPYDPLIDDVRRKPQLYDVLPFGHTTDYIGFEPTGERLEVLRVMGYSWNGSRNLEMAQATMDCLERFMQHNGRKQFQTAYRRVDRVRDVWAALKQKNPSGRLSTKNPPNLDEALKELEQIEHKEGSFDSVRFLNRVPYTYTIDATGSTKYRYDITGVEEKQKDSFVLWGDLVVMLPSGSSPGTQVTIYLAPTRTVEKPKVLYSAPLSDNSGTATFRSCPIGGVIVEYKTPQGDTQQYAYTLTRQKNVCRLPATQMRLVRDTSDTDKPGWFLAIRMGSAGIVNTGLPTVYPNLPGVQPSVDDIEEELRHQEEAEGRVNVSGLLGTQAVQEILLRAKYHPQELQRYQVEARQIQVTIGTMPVPVSRVIVQPPPLDLPLSLNIDKPALELGAVPPELAAQAQAVAAGYAAQVWAPILPHQTELICKLPPTLGDMEGPIVVRYGNKVWNIGWINRIDVPVMYEEGLAQQASETQAFNPWAVRIQGAGTLSVRFLQVKPLSTGKPLNVVPIGEDLEAIDSVQVAGEALEAFFTPTALSVSGSLTTQDTSTTFEIGQRDEKSSTYASFLYPLAEPTGHEEAGGDNPATATPTTVGSVQLLSGSLQFGSIKETTVTLAQPGSSMTGTRPNLADLYGEHDAKTKIRPFTCSLIASISALLGLAAGSLEQTASQDTLSTLSFKLTWESATPKYN